MVTMMKIVIFLLFLLVGQGKEYQPSLQVFSQNRKIWESFVRCDDLSSLHSKYDCYQDVSLELETVLNNYHKTDYGPSNARIGILSFLTMNILDYALPGIAVNLAFAINNNYYFKILDEDNTKEYAKELDFYDFRWNKVKIIELALSRQKSVVFRDWGEKIDYIMWIDADFIFLDLAMKLEDLIHQFPLSHFLASAGSIVLSFVFNVI
jgi:hypothetical protein